MKEILLFSLSLFVIFTNRLKATLNCNSLTEREVHHPPDEVGNILEQVSFK